MKKKLLAVILIACLALTTLSACGNSAEEFVSETLLGIKFQAPASWEKSKSPDGNSLYFKTDGGQLKVSVRSDAQNFDAENEDTQKNSIDSLSKNFKNFKEKESSVGTVMDDTKTFFVKFSGESDGESVNGYSTQFSMNGKTYKFLYIDHNKSLKNDRSDIYDKIIESIEYNPESDSEISAGTTEEIPEEETPEEEPPETDSAGKEYSADFNPETNQIAEYYEIQFAVPGSWQKTDDSNGLSYLIPDEGGLIVEKTDVSYDMASEENQQMFIDAYDDAEGYSEVERSTRTVLGDVTALYFIYTRNSSGMGMTVYQIAFSTPTSTYTLMCADFESSTYNHSKDFDQIIASISYTEGAPVPAEAPVAEEEVPAEEVPAEEVPAEEPAVTEETPEVTGEQNALEKAQSYLSHSSFSHDRLIEQLEYSGFTPEEATYAADNCGADWNAQALAKAQSYLSTSPHSYSGLIEQLEYEKFTEEQATYGADNCGADWNAQALAKAQSYLSTSPHSYAGLIKQLEFEKFTTDEATYGVDNCGADWNEQAALKAQSYISHSSYTREDLIRQLEFEEFTPEQAEYGASAVGY